jgi:hypothetical protein
MFPRATQAMVGCGSEMYPWKGVVNAIGDLRLFHSSETRIGQKISYTLLCKILLNFA